MKYTACGKNSFFSKESDTKILQSIYFSYEVGIINLSNQTSQCCDKTMDGKMALHIANAVFRNVQSQGE